ncbi:hypothetical protein B0H14DRAFT_3125074 [Mycena olivaceomarginata]|nr:hypothetical protein B0H14DRAFT_3125074 [Mycena olivaceomarginata]
MPPPSSPLRNHTLPPLSPLLPSPALSPLPSPTLSTSLLPPQTEDSILAVRISAHRAYDWVAEADQERLNTRAADIHCLNQEWMEAGFSNGHWCPESVVMREHAALVARNGEYIIILAPPSKLASYLLLAFFQYYHRREKVVVLDRAARYDRLKAQHDRMHCGTPFTHTDFPDGQPITWGQSVWGSGNGWESGSEGEPGGWGSGTTWSDNNVASQSILEFSKEEQKWIA